MGVDHETLLGWLTRLRLTAIRDQLDNLLDEAAEKKLTLREALAMFVEREVSRKDERRIEMALKISRRLPRAWRWGGRGQLPTSAGGSRESATTPPRVVAGKPGKADSVGDVPSPLLVDFLDRNGRRSRTATGSWTATATWARCCSSWRATVERHARAPRSADAEFEFAPCGNRMPPTPVELQHPDRLEVPAAHP